MTEDGFISDACAVERHDECDPLDFVGSTCECRCRHDRFIASGLHPVAGSEPEWHPGAMSSVATSTAHRSAPAARLRLWAWLPLAIVLACAAAYGTFIIWPYYANDLDQYPLADVAIGYHDPKDLWPRDTAAGSWFAIGGLSALMLGPWIVAATMLWATVWRRRSDLGAAAKLALRSAVLAGAALLMGMFSPLGNALRGWFLD